MSYVIRFILFLFQAKNITSIITFIVICFFVFSPIPAKAQVSSHIFINSNLDVIAANDGFCTLPEAILSVNQNQSSGASSGECAAGADEDIVEFGSIRGEILLSSPLPIIEDEVTFRGPGWLDLVIGRAANANSEFRIFYVDSTKVTFQGLGIRAGRAASGAGIYNDSGTLIIRSSSALFDNVATSSGGGIYNEGGIVVIERGTVIRNNAAGSSGGGIYSNGGTVTLHHDVVVTLNSAQSSGGGLYNTANGKVSISQATFEQNTTTSGGGGLYNAAGEISIASSSFLDNGAANGAGIFNSGLLTVSSSTFSGNQADQSGGGLYSQNPLTVNFSTFANNGAGLSGGALHNAGSAIIVSNTLLASSTAGGNCGGNITSNGYNLSDDASCGLSATGDQSAVNSGLSSARANNGGFTLTHALLAGSPAINAGDPAACMQPQMRDQRSVFRIQDGRCDIGAFEWLPYSETTVLRGRILDAEDASNNIITPLSGAIVRHIQTGLFVRTGADGFFTMVGLPPGEDNSFDYDARNAYPYDSYGAYRSLQEIKPNLLNEITRPIYIMNLDQSSATQVNPNGVTVVYNPNLNMTVTILAGTIRTEEGALYEGEITISEVPAGFTPGLLPDTLQPGLVITIQPMGLTFENPATLTFPNFDNLLPDSEVDLWSMNHQLGIFEPVGVGRVSFDGTMIETLSGGIQESSWHFPLPPGARRRGPFANIGRNRNTCSALHTASEMDIRSGSLATGFALPAYVSQGEARGLEFVYTTDRAYPYPIIPIESTIITRSMVPPLMSFNMRINGVPDPGPLSFMNTSGLLEDVDQTVRSAVMFDATSLPTSIYDYDLNLTSRYPTSNVTTRVQDQVMIVNGDTSPYGVGWGLSGLQRLYPRSETSASQDLLWTDGSGASMIFSEPTPTGGLLMRLYDTPDHLTAVQSSFSGLAPGEFTLQSAADGSVIAQEYRIPNIDFGGNDSVNQGAFYYLGTGGQESNDPTIPAGDDISFQPPGGNNTFGAQFSGYLRIPKSGNVTFSVYLDDIFEMRLNDQLVFSNYEDTSPDTIPGPTLYLEKGYIPITINYGEGGGNAVIALSAFGGGLPGGVIPAEYFSTEQPGRTVVIFQPPPGDYTTIQRNLDGTYIRRYLDGSFAEFNADGYQTSFEDRNGNNTEFEYNANHQLITITDPLQAKTELVYVNNLLDSVTDPMDRETLFFYDTDFNLTRVLFSDNITEMNFGYNGDHLMMSETDPRGFVTNRIFDGQGRLLNSTLPGGTYREVRPAQSAGLGGTEASPLPAIVIARPDTPPTPDTQPDLTATTYTDYPAGVGTAPRTTQYDIGPLGYVASITNPANEITRIERDLNGNPIQVILPSSAQVNMTYDANGNLSTVTDAQAGGTTTFTYEPNFNQVESITNSFQQTTQFDYDSTGNLVEVTSPLGRNLTMDYDSAGLIQTLENTLGTVTSFDYNNEGNVTDIAAGTGADLRQIELDYTDEGYVQTITDPLNREHRFVYDDFGRITKETLPGGRTVEYSYDQAGNLLGIVTPNDDIHELTYRPDGLPETYIAPAVTNGGTNTTSYAYNTAQELTQITRPDGQIISFAYDIAGRPDTVTIPRNNAPVTLDVVYDSAGRLTGVTAPDAVDVGFIYDSGWEVPNRIEMPAGEAVTGSVSYIYDEDYRVTAISVNDANPVSYAYDADGAITAAGSLTLDYDLQSGLLTDTTLGAVTDEIAYSVHGEPTDYTANYGSTTLYDVEYTRDGLGRITQMAETIAGQTVTFEFRYDTAGRLENVERNNQVVGSYIYDDNGNRTNTNGIDADYDPQDRLLTYGGVTYTYTANGELLTRTENGEITSYNYDVMGNLIGVTLPNGTQITYLVDTLNRRVGKMVNGTLVQGFIYEDELEPIAELDGQSNIVSRFVYGSQPHVPDYMIRGGVTYRIITDHLGSVRLLVDVATGDVAQQMDYDAWGNVTQDTNPGFQPFGYAGGIYDDATGLVRFGARDYDPEIGRWTAKDPIGFDGGDANLYAYVGNDPINGVDPSGEFLHVAAGCLAGGAANTIVGGLFDHFGGKQVTAKSLLGDFASGCLSGGATALCGPACGYAAGVAGDYINSKINPNEPFDLGDSLINNGIGLIGGEVIDKIVPAKFPVRDFSRRWIRPLHPVSTWNHIRGSSANAGIIRTYLGNYLRYSGMEGIQNFLGNTFSQVVSELQVERRGLNWAGGLINRARHYNYTGRYCR